MMESVNEKIVSLALECSLLRSGLILLEHHLAAGGNLVWDEHIEPHSWCLYDQGGEGMASGKTIEGLVQSLVHPASQDALSSPPQLNSSRTEP